jgi:hypoxanthine phosphoribosyltransferase
VKDSMYALSSPVITKEQINDRIRELSDFIANQYPDPSRVVLIGVLKGSFVFLSDLIRNLPFTVEIDFIQASSYGSGTSSSKEVKIIKDLTISIEGKDVVLIEDIIDSGNTIQKLKNLLMARNPKSLILCSLLSKPARRETQVVIDWVGFTIPDLFIVGYGLDVAEKFRNLPYLAEAISIL